MTHFRIISDVLSEGIDENGGYLVPEEYDSRLIDVLTEENIFRGLANVITTSGQHKISATIIKIRANLARIIFSWSAGPSAYCIQLHFICFCPFTGQDVFPL